MMGWFSGEKPGKNNGVIVGKKKHRKEAP